MTVLNASNTMKLINQNYGKQRVRVMKVFRDGATHTVKELTIGLALEGDFETSYTAGDNSKVVPTDTVKNTITALSRDYLGSDTERFLAFLGHHFRKKYEQVEKVTVTSKERVWQRLTIQGTPHPHTFSAAQNAVPFVEVIVDSSGQTAHSGIENLLIMKSTASAFIDYPRCEFTTLPETTDRILATSLKATWQWAVEPDSYTAANAAILDALLGPFATEYSPSAQTTLFQMGTAALQVCPEIGEINIAMPNKHCLFVPLEKFGIENYNEIFLPTDEPHGQIEATIGRD